LEELEEIIQKIVSSIVTVDISENGKILASNIFVKISCQTFWEIVFFAILAKFGTIGQEATLALPAEAGCRTWKGCFCTIGLYFVTIKWQRIFKGKLQVTGSSRRFSACDC